MTQHMGAYGKPSDHGKLGSGSRFKAVEANAAAHGARNPAAVAAVAGRKAHGEANMKKYAAEKSRLLVTSLWGAEL